jgi:hypothetical protein
MTFSQIKDVFKYKPYMSDKLISSLLFNWGCEKTRRTVDKKRVIVYWCKLVNSDENNFIIKE